MKKKSETTFAKLQWVVGITTLAWAILILAPRSSMAQAEISCACPEVRCGPCENENGVDFYTEKCGPGSTKVKSCKRLHCEPVSDQPACLAKLTGGAEVRTVASTANDSSRSAEVILAVGHSRVERKEATRDMSEEIVKGMRLFAGDRIVTQDDGRVRIRLPELSEIFVSPQSELRIAEALVEKRAGLSKRTILLDLQRGRVRSRVQGHYKDGASTFEVKTRSAVAGVRGTDFTVTFDPGDSQWKTEVRTVTGAVSLDSVGEKPQHIDVTAEKRASFIMPAPPMGASSFDVEAALARGHMTSLSTMSSEDLRELDRLMDLSFVAPKTSHGVPSHAGEASSERRAPASGLSADASLCRAPAAAFNQCSWTCEGNKKGASACRSDLPGVQCVRRLCRANGQWAEPTVLPVKRGVECEGSKPVVGDCGGYF